MPCTCRCRQEQITAEEQARKKQQRLDRIRRLKANGLQDRNKYLASFSEFDLLIIDDLGIERNSEYAQERVYNVVGSRYLSRLPFIITTNLILAELKDPKDIAHARIYDRILERCAPVRFSGRNYRTENAENTKNAIR